MKRILLILLLAVIPAQARFGDEFDYSEYYTPDEVDALLALYLKLDTSNDPLTNDLDFGGNDILSSGALGFKVSGDNDDYLSFLTVSNTPTIGIIGGNFYNITSDGDAPGIRFFEDINNNMIVGWTGDKAAIVSSHDLDIVTVSNNGDITLTPHGTGIVNIDSDVNMNSNSFTTVVGGITPTANNHLVIKEYVDVSVAGLHFDMFFDNLDSGINDPNSDSDYLSLQDMDTGEAATTSTGDALGQGDDQEVISYISSASLPFVEIQPGLINIHLHARKNNIGQKDSIVFGKLYHRADDGTETLMATTEDSAELTNSVVEYNLHGNVASSVAFISTDRLLLKIRADVQSSGGGNAQIEITQEGVFDSRVSSLVDTDVLSQLFVRQDGSKELTDNWPVGGFDITNIGNLGIGTGSPDQNLEVRGVSPIIRIRATGTIGNAAAYVEFGRTTAGNWVRTGYVGDAISGNEDIYLVAEDSDLKLGDSSSNAVLTLSGGDATFSGSINVGDSGKINFRDTDISIGSTLTDGILDIGANVAIDLFYDNTDRGAGEDGQHLNINRRAAGDDYISLYVNSNRQGLIGFSGDDDLLQLTANALTVNGAITATGTIIAGNISLAGDTITFLDGSTIAEVDGGVLVLIANGGEVIIDSDLDMEGHDIRLVCILDFDPTGFIQFDTNTITKGVMTGPWNMSSGNLTNVDIDSGTIDGITGTANFQSLTASGTVQAGTLTDGTATISGGDYTGQDMSLTLSATADAFCVDGVINSFEVENQDSVTTRARIQSESSGTFNTGTLGSAQLVLHQITADLVSASFAMAEPKMAAADYLSQWSGDVTDVRSIPGSATIINRTLTAGAEWSGIVTSNSSGGATLIFENIGSVCEVRNSGTLVETAGTLIFNAVGGDFSIDSAASSIAVTGTPQINYIGGRFDGTAGSHTGADPETTSTGGLFTAGGADNNIGIDVTNVDGFAIRTAGGDIIFVGLPNSDPSVAGQLYHDSGTVKISI